MTNPFAQTVPTVAPAQQPQAATGNPFAQAAPATTAQPAAPNPFAAAQQAVQQGTHPIQQAQAYAQPQQYAPQQQTYAPPAPQAQAGPPQFGTLAGAPAPVVGEGGGASLAHMFGRLIMIFPLREETVPRRPEHITAEQRAAGNVNQQRLTATVVVLDSGPGQMQPIATNGKPNAFPPIPPTEFAPLPYVRKGMWINQSRLISQARDYLPGSVNGGPNGTPGIIVGRVAKAGPQQNDPWYLLTATEQEITLARQYLDAVQQGHLPNPLAT